MENGDQRALKQYHQHKKAEGSHLETVGLNDEVNNTMHKTQKRIVWVLFGVDFLYVQHALPMQPKS